MSQGEKKARPESLSSQSINMPGRCIGLGSRSFKIEQFYSFFPVSSCPLLVPSLYHEIDYGLSIRYIIVTSNSEVFGWYIGYSFNLFTSIKL